MARCTAGEPSGRGGIQRGGGCEKLRGVNFTFEERQWCVEDIAFVGGDGEVGLYAYDTGAWPSATTRLNERCRLFGNLGYSSSSTSATQ